MRKFLLATAAMLGLVTGATGAAHAQAAKPPAPGTLVVHLNGLLNFQMNVIGSSANTVNTSAGADKLNPIGAIGFLRLYPGFDAQTAGGLQYGVAAELRTAYTVAGQGQIESGAGGLATEGLVIRRAYAYVGTKSAGFVRIGQGDGVWGLLSTGEYFNYGDGNLWDSDGGVGAAVPGSVSPKGLFTAVSVLYTTNKIVYLSPNIAGFQAGVDYEPNSNAFKQGEVCPNPNSGYGGCATLASAPGGEGNARRKNTFTGGLEYTGVFDGFGVKFNGDYLVSSPIANSSGASIETITSPITGAVTHETGFKRMGIGMVGAQVSYAGFLVGGNIKDGQVNNGYTFLYPGQRNAMFYEITGEYTAGPATIGVQYFNDQAAGGHLPGNHTGSTETDYGFDLGANYAVTPNLGLYLVYLYGHRHQAGYDFITNGTGTTAFNNVQAQAISVGTQLKW